MPLGLAQRDLPGHSAVAAPSSAALLSAPELQGPRVAPRATKVDGAAAHTFRVSPGATHDA